MTEGLPSADAFITNLQPQFHLGHDSSALFIAQLHRFSLRCFPTVAFQSTTYERGPLTWLGILCSVPAQREKGALASAHFPRLSICSRGLQPPLTLLSCPTVRRLSCLRLGLPEGSNLHSRRPLNRRGSSLRSPFSLLNQGAPATTEVHSRRLSSSAVGGSSLH